MSCDESDSEIYPSKYHINGHSASSCGNIDMRPGNTISTTEDPDELVESPSSQLY